MSPNATTDGAGVSENKASDTACHELKTGGVSGSVGVVTEGCEAIDESISVHSFANAIMGAAGRGVAVRVWRRQRSRAI